MAYDSGTGGGNSILASLGDEQRAQLEEKSYVRVGDDVVWIDRERGVRREAMSRLYYIQTTKGVFRVSRIAREIVEV
jgi:hypothetical protein